MKQLILITTGLLIFSNTSTFAQTVIKGNVNTWFLLLNRFYLSDKFTLTNEVHERTGDILSDQATFILRPSIDYALNDNVELSVGYSFVRSWPYAPYSQPIPRNEHNIWEQVMLKSTTGRVSIQHRFRFEHRFVDNIVVLFPNVNPHAGIDGTTYSNRFRYRLIVSFDLVRFENNQSLFFNGFDELWINQANNMMPTSFARNWIYTGLGYKFNNDFNIQLGHMRQQDKTGNNNYISSSIIQLSLFKNFALYKKK